MINHLVHRKRPQFLSYNREGNIVTISSPLQFFRLQKKKKKKKKKKDPNFCPTTEKEILLLSVHHFSSSDYKKNGAALFLVNKLVEFTECNETRKE